VGHGPWCTTATFPTRCWECRAAVFFYSCSHGSRVLFDELGWPWPLHDCDGSWSRKLHREVDEQGRTRVDVADGVIVVREPRREPPTPEMSRDEIDRIRARRRDGSTPPPIVRMDPPRTADELLVGVLREFTSDVDPFAKYGMPETTGASALLQQIGRQPVGRVTIHVDSPFGNEIESYTGWVPTDLLEGRGLFRGLTVEARFQSVPIPEVEIAWFCSSLEVLS